MEKTEHAFTFLKNYFNFKQIHQKIIEYQNFIGLPIGGNNLRKLKDQIDKNFKKDFKFSFFSELNDKKIAKITNLKIKDVADSKKRQFSDPIYWKDTNKNLKLFKKTS